LVSTLGPGGRQNGPVGGLIGTVPRIKEGYAYLSAVEYRLPHDSIRTLIRGLQVPDGQWIGSTHWRSNYGSSTCSSASR